MRQVSESQVEISGCLFLSLRALVSTPWSVLRDEDANLVDPQFGCDAKQVLEGEARDEWRFLCSLVGHEEAMPPEERLIIATRAVATVKSLRSTGFIASSSSSSSEEEEQLLLLSLLLYQTQFRVAHNVHTVYAPAGEVSGDIPLRPIGTAVYRALTLMNHSCCQNTAKYYDDGPGGATVLVVAKRTIRVGEEVTNTYGPHHTRDTRQVRRERLRTGYKFECRCEACLQDYPTLSALQDAPVKKGLSRQLEKVLSAYRRCFAARDFKGALASVCDCLRRLDAAVASGTIAFPHIKYGMAEVALDSCWWAMVKEEEEERKKR